MPLKDPLSAAEVCLKCLQRCCRACFRTSSPARLAGCPGNAFRRSKGALLVQLGPAGSQLRALRLRSKRHQAVKENARHRYSMQCLAPPCTCPHRQSVILPELHRGLDRRSSPAASSPASPVLCRSSRSDKSDMVAHSAVAEAAVVERRPTQDGRYGRYGGKYVPETLITALTELEQAYDEAMQDEAFKVCLTLSRLVCIERSPESQHPCVWYTVATLTNHHGCRQSWHTSSRTMLVERARSITQRGFRSTTASESPLKACLA